MNEYPYRKGVNAIVIDTNNNFLIVQKKSYSDNQWDFPGGGLEENESPETGILRELKEELGSVNFEIIKQSPINIKFDWPQEAIDVGFKKHGKWWRGQEKYQFIVRFTGNTSDLKLQVEEIKKIKWVNYDELKNHLIFEGQWENAQSVIQDAGLAGNPLDKLSERISTIENRNKKVELDKAWETSVTRKVSIAVFTYLSISLYFLAIDVDKPFINAVVPTLGFLLSTLSLPWIRKYWEKNGKQ